MLFVKIAVAGVITLVVTVVVSVGSHFFESSSSSGPPVDLLHGRHWQLAGVEQKDDGLHVTGTSLAIVRQDGSPGQDNPPVNLYGTYLGVERDFSLSMQLSNISGKAALGFYGRPPLIEDEYRVEQGTLAVAMHGKDLTISVSNQLLSGHTKQSHYLIAAASTHKIVIEDNGGRLTFKIDDRQIGLPISDEGIFNSGQIWFGFSASDGSFTVRSLTALSARGGNLVVHDARTTSIASDPHGFAMRAQSKRPGFLIGASVALGPMVSDPTYSKLLGNFNAVTTENVGKFQTIHPQPQVYNFNDMDAIVSIARSAHMRVHGHALVFGEANPAWVQTIARDHPERLQQVMIDHVKTVVTHYKGRVEGWDVINEPLADYDTATGEGGLRKDIWYNAMGPSYIATALRAAHEADPRATLWINDFGMEFDDQRFEQMVSLAKSLQAEGVPLTGIGFESHIDDGDTIQNDTHVDTSALKSRIAALAALGLKTRFSEIDVSSESEYPVFADFMQTCIEQSACEGVTFWGVTDKYSSSGSFDSNGIYSPGIGLPWDGNENPLQPVGEVHNLLGS